MIPQRIPKKMSLPNSALRCEKMDNLISVFSKRRQYKKHHQKKRSFFRNTLLPQNLNAIKLNLTSIEIRFSIQQQQRGSNQHFIKDFQRNLKYPKVSLMTFVMRMKMQM